MRTAFFIATAVALAAVPALAAGAGPASICSNAGFRAGTASFDMCVANVGGDDPLSALEPAEAERVPVDGAGNVIAPANDALGALDGDRIKPAVAPVRPPKRDGEFQSVTGPGGFPGGTVPNGGGLPDGDVPPPNNRPSAPPPSAPLPGGGFVTAPTAPTAPTPPQFNAFTVTMPAWNWGP